MVDLKQFMIRHPDQVNAMGGTELMQNRLYNNRFVTGDHEDGSFEDLRDCLKDSQIWYSRFDRNTVRDMSKLQILYVHDLPEDPMYEYSLGEALHTFDQIIFVSRYQFFRFQEKFPALNAHNSSVVHNCLDNTEWLTSRDNNIKKWEKLILNEAEPIRLVYHTTPHRGLNILAAAYGHLCFKHNITLDVFSSFGVYGWEHRDKEYKPVFDQLASLPNVTLHGAKPNATVRKFLENEAHVFAYPCTWEETSCLALMEAIDSNLVCLHPNLGALPETAGTDTWTYPYRGDIQQHAELFVSRLDNLLTSIRHYPEKYNRHSEDQEERFSLQDYLFAMLDAFENAMQQRAKRLQSKLYKEQ